MFVNDLRRVGLNRSYYFTRRRAPLPAAIPTTEGDAA